MKAEKNNIFLKYHCHVTDYSTSEVHIVVVAKTIYIKGLLKGLLLESCLL